jgi:hypothetical protein
LNKRIIDTVKNILLDYFYNKDIKDFRRIPYNFKPKWWDLDYKYKIIAYGGAESGPADLFGLTGKSVTKSAVITMQQDGNYYLYLDFVISPIDVIF